MSLLVGRQRYGDGQIEDAGTVGASGSNFRYIQIYKDELKQYHEQDVSEAPLADLCPGGDCFKACEDQSLLFNGNQYNFDKTATIDTSFTSQDVTLFGICTNMGDIIEAVNNTNYFDDVKDFFQAKNVDYEVNKVVVSTALCLYDTCQATRHPVQCTPYCSPLALQDGISVLNFQNVYKCITKLCDNTCGLPFADQDVLGIGVLVSFAMQAILILIYTIYCLLQLSRPIKKSQKMNDFADWVVKTVGHKVNAAAGAFLVAECFFAVFATVAAFRLDPLDIDPLNGYALLFIATIGFIPPIFTLLLLHSQKMTEWYHTCLVFLSWSLSTALFFILIHNLRTVRYNDERIAEARKALYSVDSCGGYSAMSLCQENGKNDPLHFMMGFFNEDRIPNIENIPVLWVYATLVLFTLLGLRISNWRKMVRQTTWKNNTSGGTLPNRWHSSTSSRPIAVVVSHLSKYCQECSFIFAVVVFYFTFGYQIRMVIKYLEMDLIDRSHNGWTFGQIVAVLLWAPLLLELPSTPLLRWVRNKLYKNTHTADHGGSSDPLLRPDSKPSADPVVEPKPAAMATCVSVPVSPLPTPLLSPSTNEPMATNTLPLSPV